MADARGADAQRMPTSAPIMTSERGHRPMTSPELLAERYGRPADPVRVRRRLMVTLVVFVTVAVAFVVWAAAARGRGNVEWTDLGLDQATLTPERATFTFQLALPAGDQAICTVRAVNERRTEVGRKDVVLGPSESGRLRTSVTLRTTERAAGGGVKACVLR
jgi:hypothetical protein